MAFHVLSTVCNLGAFVYPVGPGDRTGAPLREEMNKVDKDYVSVTEIAGDEVTQEKDRLRSFGCWVLSGGCDVCFKAKRSRSGQGEVSQPVVC